MLDPCWSQKVLDEMRRNRPEGVTEQKIDRRIGAMTKFFPRAMTSGYESLIPEAGNAPAPKTSMSWQPLFATGPMYSRPPTQGIPPAVLGTVRPAR